MSIYDISDFMALGGQTVPEDVDHEITSEELLKFFNRVDDELMETWEAISYINESWGIHENESWGIHEPIYDMPPRDIPETIDGFLDIAYTALSAAIRLVGAEKAARCWDEVLTTNLAKVDGTYGPVIRNVETGKIEKPEGWEAPRIAEILGVTE